ncbi:MAG: aldehyde dehydrogenase (NADP(+)), partial [Paracoccus sp. (in: a-proteobacteria)]
PEPIPFFGELGSVNPMFMLPAAMAARGADLGADWAASLCMGAGQFCTNPGIAIVIDGSDADAFTASAKAALEKTAPQVMLTDGIARAYQAGQRRFADNPAVTPVVTTTSEGREAQPNLVQTSADAFLSDHDLGEEVFGPLGLIIRAASVEQMDQLARGLSGQLTVTLHMDEADLPTAQSLLPVLERKAGRILVNGFPTGVEVVDSMVHG